MNYLIDAAALYESIKLQEEAHRNDPENVAEPTTEFILALIEEMMSEPAVFSKDYAVVCKNMKRLLKERNMTQKELAIKSGVCEVSISLYARGVHYPASIYLQEMAEAFEVHPGEFFKPC